MAGNVFIVDIQDRDTVGGNFLVQTKQVSHNKNGKPYLALILMDRTGTIEARLWDNVEQIDPRFESGDFVHATGQAIAFQGRLQLKVKNIKRLDPDSIDLDEYLPSSPFDRGEMLGRVKELLESLQPGPLREVLLGALLDEEFRRSFGRAPAAKTIHHAYLGGLLEHTLSVMELADRVAGHYAHVDRDLLLAGAFLHDLGKIRELDRERTFDYTDEGRLIGHVVMGAMLFADWAEAHGGVPDELVLKITHMILSHHGSYEFGSPRRPKFTEALLLSHLDELDSKVQSFKEISDRQAGRGWSSYQRVFDRYLYLGSPAEPAPPGRPDEPEPARGPGDAGPRKGGGDDLTHRPLAKLGASGGAQLLDLFEGGEPGRKR
ncbi:MAG: HD domain-containing protein [Deltaproteobacteria bacterium]|nr:HD domain-containing protein [Deltaproteobacteria bacterium]